MDDAREGVRQKTLAGEHREAYPASVSMAHLSTQREEVFARATVR